MIEGIDYYAGNGSPSLSGLAFAFIKATEGAHFTDRAFSRERTRIRAAGLVFGAYHFGHPEHDVGVEVEHFLSVARPAAGDVLILDYEDEKGNFGKLSATHLTRWKNSWLAKVKARFPRNQVGLYCNVDTWVHKLHDNNARDFLFIAQYGVSSPNIRDPWTVWQYASDHLDHDKARFGSAAAMRAWARHEDQAGQPH